VLAHAVRALDACAGVMVTASHNPPADNGYKVYLGRGLGGPGGDGAQIVPPADVEIEVESYVDGALAVLDTSIVDEDYRSQLVVAYTAMHGVGAEVLTTAFTR